MKNQDKKIEKFNKKTFKKLKKIKKDYEKIFGENCDYLSFCILGNSIFFNNDYYDKPNGPKINPRYDIKLSKFNSRYHTNYKYPFEEEK